MTEHKKEKKSESIEVRVPYELKQEFMQRAAQEGVSASDLIRRFMADYLAPQSKESRTMLISALKPAAFLGATAVAALFTLASPTTVQATPDLKAVFDRFDADKNGAINAAEFVRGMGENQLVMRAPAPAPGMHKKVIPFPAAPGAPALTGENVVMRADLPPPPGAQPMVLPLHGEVPGAGAFPPPAEFSRDEFARQDGNRDGKVEFAEFQAYHRKMMRAGFDTQDANRDGAIDSAELAAIRKQLPAGVAGPELAQLDVNGDGKISFEEFAR